MKKRKVCVILTTRGNYAKMKSVMAAIKKRPDLELQVIVGGGATLNKYGNILGKLGDEPVQVDRVVHFLLEGENPITMAKSAGLAVIEFSTLFENLKPDVVMVIADRFECLAMAMAAGYMNIPIAHVEGGEVSGSIDESVRHAITKMSHLHFPATGDAARRIERLGEAPGTIHNVGCTSLDVIASLDLADLGPVTEMQNTVGVGPVLDLKPSGYLVVIQHPVTTEYDQNLFNINQTIEAIDDLKIPAVWIWPNMDAGSDGLSKGIRVYREHHAPEHIHFFKSLPIEKFAPLLANAACMVGNSSSGIRESAFLGVPTVNIGTRQGGRERGANVMDVPYDKSVIEKAIREQMGHGPYPKDELYGDGKAGEKVAKVLAEHEFTLQKRITY